MSVSLAVRAEEPEITLIDYGTREKWVAARRSGVGASESAALFGISPYTTIHRLWAEKTGRLPPREMDAEYLDWGQFLEEPIAQRYATVTGRTIWHGGPFCIARHPTIAEMFSTPDRFVIEAPDKGRPGLLQVKNTLYKMDEWADGIPPDYIQVQCQHEMAVTGREWASTAVLLGGNKFRYFDLERNQEFIDELQEQIRLFWDLVKNNEPPPPEDATDKWLPSLKALHPKDNGQIVELPPEALEWWAEVEKARKEESAAKKQKEIFTAKLVAAIADSTFGQLPDGRRLSLKTTSVVGYQVEPSSYRSLKLEKESRR